MSNLEYKGYIGTIEHDLDDGVLFGRITNIEGGLMYEGTTLPELVENMYGVVDSYLALCREQNEEPRRPYSGNIALRIDPILHARVAARASATGASMNQVIVDAITASVGDGTPSTSGGRGRNSRAAVARAD